MGSHVPPQPFQDGCFESHCVAYALVTALLVVPYLLSRRYDAARTTRASLWLRAHT